MTLDRNDILSLVYDECVSLAVFNSSHNTRWGPHQVMEVSCFLKWVDPQIINFEMGFPWNKQNLLWGVPIYGSIESINKQPIYIYMYIICILYCIVLYYIILYYMLCYIILYFMLCYIILYYIIWYYIKLYYIYIYSYMTGWFCSGKCWKKSSTMVQGGPPPSYKLVYKL